MLFYQIRDRIEALIRLGGWSNSVPAPDLAGIANEGLRQFSNISEHNIQDLLITTANGQGQYPIKTDPNDPDWINLHDDAQWNASATAPIWLPQATRNQLVQADKNWRSRPAGTPCNWYWAGPQVIGLWPVPSQDGMVISFEGARHEAEMVNDGDSPLVDRTFHEGICLLGAWHHGKLYSRMDENALLRQYYEDGKAMAEDFKDTLTAQEAGLIQRRVGRPAQEYMGVGSKQLPFWPWPY